MDAQITTAPLATRARKPASTPPVRHDQFAHLSLIELRDYRRDLQSEEGKVSYWRRIIQARLDMVRAADPLAATTAGTRVLTSAAVGVALNDTTVRSGRLALIALLPIDDIPPLPSLAELWDRCIAIDDEVRHVALVHDLEVAEVQLSAFRAALHRRLATSTGELIARYRDEPSACVSALPLAPRRTTTR